MYGDIIGAFILGALLTWGGYKIVFTSEGLEWMYEKKFWSRKSSLFYNEHQKDFHNKYISGLGIFVLGLIMLGGSLVTGLLAVLR